MRCLIMTSIIPVYYYRSMKEMHAFENQLYTEAEATIVFNNLTLVREAKYCDERVFCPCLSVRVSRESHGQTAPNFCCVLRVGLRG